MISLDWTSNDRVWKTPNILNSTSEGTAIATCRAIKNVYSQTRCFIYHNLEVTIDVQESMRADMYNPSFSDYFLQYNDGYNNNNTIIAVGTGGQPGTSYFWDSRNASANLQQQASIMSTILNPWVDGSQFDSIYGYHQGDDNPPVSANVSELATESLRYCSQLSLNTMINTFVAAGKYTWAALGYWLNVGPGITQGASFSANSFTYNGISYNQGQYAYTNCTQFMTTRCNTAFQSVPLSMLMDPNNADQSLAAFLLVRGPYAWIGYPWMGFDVSPPWSPEFGRQVGVPQGPCVQVSNTLFTRQWTYGTVSLDCASWQAVVPTSGTDWQTPTYPPTTYVMPLQQNLTETTTGGVAAAFYVHDGYTATLSPWFTTAPGSRGTAWYTNSTTITQFFAVYPVGGFLTPSYSITLWVYLQSLPGSNFPTVLVSGAQSTYQTNEAFVLYLTTSYILGFLHGPNNIGSPFCSVQLSASTALNQWMHVAATYDATTSTANMYVNAAVVSTTTGASSYTGNTQLQAGYWADLGYPFIVGWLQFLTYSNYAFTLAEVQHAYNL